MGVFVGSILTGDDGWGDLQNFEKVLNSMKTGYDGYSSWDSVSKVERFQAVLGKVMMNTRMKMSVDYKFMQNHKTGEVALKITARTKNLGNISVIVLKDFIEKSTNPNLPQNIAESFLVAFDEKAKYIRDNVTGQTRQQIKEARKTIAKAKVVEETKEEKIVKNKPKPPTNNFVKKIFQKQKPVEETGLIETILD